MSTDDPNPSDLPPAVRETLDSLGGALGDIADLDKEQLNETIGLLETLGHDQAAGILRSRREVLKGAGAATGLGLAGLAGATATGGARAQSDTQTGTIGNGNQDADLQDVSAESVNTDGADITGETFIRSTRESDSASTTAGTFVNAYDGELKDSLGELNSSGQLTPTETGEYQVLIGVDIRGNTVAGDSIGLRVRDVDGASDVRLRKVEASDSNFQTAMPFFVEMTAGTTYELQVSNLDSSFVLTANRDTKGTIVRSIVHP